MLIKRAVDIPASEINNQQVHSGLSASHKTLMFNGYADQVAGLCAGMDLRKTF
jgi:hypothetical protein